MSWDVVFYLLLLQYGCVESCFRLLTSLSCARAAIEGGLKFAQQHRMLVEPSSAAALGVAYSSCPSLLRAVHASKREVPRVGVVVCGGSVTSIEYFQEFKAMFKIE